MSLLREGENMNQSDAQPVPNYVTCPCQHCSGKIEFDANQLDAAENTTVPCPHCGLETIIFVPQQQGVPPIISDESFNLRLTEDAKCQTDLGIAYFRQKNYSDAAKRFAKAAEQGDPKAQCNLGICYMEGLGVAKDEAEAAKWFSKAAEQGVTHAEYCLGVAYFSGRGVSKDISVALKWWHRAAEHGHPDAQYNLGICYETATKGDCIAQDYVEAYKWMKLAAAQGYEGAQKKCEEIVLKMNAEQIGAAEPTDQMLWKHERLTPSLFSEFIGQNRVKERLELAIAAAKHRREPLGHVLLIGAPGSGKATLANILAKAMGVNLKITSGATIEKAGDLENVMSSSRREEPPNLWIGSILHQRAPHFFRKMKVRLFAGKREASGLQ